jgi:hypothetical protein
MWQAITLSPNLQRALFFEADPTASASQPVQNPLLVELFQPFFAPNAAKTFSWSWPGTATSILAMPWAQAPEAFKRADASWRRMLVTQPPVQTMVIVQTSHGMGGSSERRAVLRDLSLRMGMLYDLAVPFLHYGEWSFRIKWLPERATSLSCSALRRVAWWNGTQKGWLTSGLTALVGAKSRLITASGWIWKMRMHGIDTRTILHFYELMTSGVVLVSSCVIFPVFEDLDIGIQGIQATCGTLGFPAHWGLK